MGRGSSRLKSGQQNFADDAAPHEVIGLHVKEGMTYLRAWREYLGLTQAELAEKAGITQAALSRMEGGESRLRKATRQKLASAMGINFEQLDP